MKKIISFSLYGGAPKYTVGMRRNLELSANMYPDWKVYIYHNDSVPAEFLNEFRKNPQVELKNMNNVNVPGMFWRFSPNDDPDVDRFIVRDSDSRITKREVLAVEEWEREDNILHIMRDHPNHSYVILGGMWGMKRRPELNIRESFLSYTQSTHLYEKMTDMNFLRDCIYPTYKNSSTVHATFSKIEDWAKDFPSAWENYKFVGEIYNEDESREPQWKQLK